MVSETPNTHPSLFVFPLSSVWGGGFVLEGGGGHGFCGSDESFRFPLSEIVTP